MNFTTELNRLMNLLDDGLITQEAYNEAVDNVFAKEAKRIEAA
jgi:hypothetical protein